MKKPSDKSSSEKTSLHPRNKNRDRYDLSALTEINSELKQHIRPNKYGGKSINFSNPKTSIYLLRSTIFFYKFN